MNDYFIQTNNNFQNFNKEAILMNITDMITSLSEETIITASIFAGAAIIYILRKFIFLNQRISEFEQVDAMGRDSLERDLLIMNGLIDDIRFEFKNTRDNVEEELVQHELLGLNMAPRFQDLVKQIADVLDDQSDSIIDVKRNMENITTSVHSLSMSTSNNQNEQINSMIPKLVSKLDEVNRSVKEESSKVAGLLHEVGMIKRAIGVE
jgi:methyl-accepting chemotaxis protein